MRMEMKRVVWLVFVNVGAMLLVAACGTGATKNEATSQSQSSGATQQSSNNSTSHTKIKVALVAPSAINDLSFTQTMYAALDGLKDSENLEISVSDNQYVTSDAARVIRQYASQGYDLVIAHGSQYGSTIQQLAPQFPKVSFAWGTAGSTFDQPNVFAYQASANEGGYVAGYTAAKLSKSHILGAIGPVATGDDKLYVDGFKAGALAADSSTTVHPVYTGSYSDASLYTAAAKTFASGGADVLTGTTQASAGAIGVARSSNLPWFGNDWSMVSLAPKNVVATQIYNWSPALKQMFSSIHDGKLGGSTYDIKLANGGERIEFNPDYDLPSSIKDDAMKVISGITDGSIVVPQ